MDTNKLGRYTALFSFIVGTFILLGFLVSRDDSFQFLGFFYFMVAIVINCIVLLSIIVANAINKRTKGFGLTFLLMIANLPIAFGYMEIAAWYDNRLPIKFYNKTGTRIESIELYENGVLVDNKTQLDKGDYFRHTFSKRSFVEVNLKVRAEGEERITTNILGCDCRKSTVEDHIYNIGEDSCMCLYEWID